MARIERTPTPNRHRPVSTAQLKRLNKLPDGTKIVGKTIHGSVVIRTVSGKLVSIAPDGRFGLAPRKGSPSWMSRGGES